MVNSFSLMRSDCSAGFEALTPCAPYKVGQLLFENRTGSSAAMAGCTLCCGYWNAPSVGIRGSEGVSGFLLTYLVQIHFCADVCVFCQETFSEFFFPLYVSAEMLS